VAVTKADIEHVAELARLELRPEDLESLRNEMNRILAFFGRLSEVDTDDVEPAFALLTGSDLFRPDVPAPMLDTEDALANAPDTYDGHFRVPGFLPDE
jgi:aspartyl-tRNA(Asn)/glutamyl-tRNA(Gln) amidotransferase subunit C